MMLKRVLVDQGIRLHKIKKHGNWQWSPMSRSGLRGVVERRRRRRSIHLLPGDTPEILLLQILIDELPNRNFQGDK